jgi:hypothetical protein
VTEQQLFRDGFMQQPRRKAIAGETAVAVMPSSSRCFSRRFGASYAAAVQALLEDGPLQGTTVEVEAVEGRPPKTVDVPDDKGSVCRYCLAEWTQEGMTAAYTFLYAV